MPTSPQWKEIGDSGAPELTPEEESAIERARDGCVEAVAELLFNIIDATVLDDDGACELLADLVRKWPRRWAYKSCRKCGKLTPHECVIGDCCMVCGTARIQLS